MGEGLIFSVFAILAICMWIHAYMSISNSDFANPITKLVWIILIFIFPIFGAFIYFQLGKTHTIPKQRRFNPKFKRR